jgi:hypothetical protein
VDDSHRPDLHRPDSHRPDSQQRDSQRRDPGEERGEADVEARPLDRTVQARVPRALESTLKREARRRRLTVSHLIRNVLEDAFQLVDDVVANVDGLVADSVQLARRVGGEARRMADAVREPGRSRPSREPPAPAPRPEPPDRFAGPGRLADVLAWSCVVLNRDVTCSACDTAVGRGAEGWMGLGDDPAGPRTWLCVACRHRLAGGGAGEES